MLPAIDKNKRYTYADYITWGEDVRCEIIDGVVYDMSPAPGWLHQELSTNLLIQLGVFLEGKPCKVFHAPFDVRLDNESDDGSVVQPDIVVICNSEIISGTGCTGAPDMVIEILSPSTASKDMIIKYNRYLRAGVREYWIVDPKTKSVRVCVLKDGKYDSIDYLDPGGIQVNVLEGCEIDMRRVFANLEPDED